MPLIKDGKFVPDRFIFIPDGQAFPDDGGVMVTFDRFQSECATLIARHRPLGVRLAASQNPDVLKDELANIDAIALEFPVFKDGRSFSWARMLRERFGYKGEIRAVGHFLYDQLAFMLRVGFDAFDVRQDFRIEEFDRAMREMTYVYQPSVDRRKTVMQIRRGE